MKQVLILCSVLIALSIPFSCKSKEKTKLIVPHEEKSKVAVWLIKNGGADTGPVVQVVDRKDVNGAIVSDTQIFRKEFSLMMDSTTNRPMKDSAGNNRTQMSWVKISKDSVCVFPIDLDSLLKARWPATFGSVKQ